MAVQNKLLYAFRGWIAFVAFMDLGTAFRSYIERRSFFGHHLDNEYIEGKVDKGNISLRAPNHIYYPTFVTK